MRHRLDSGPMRPYPAALWVPVLLLLGCSSPGQVESDLPPATQAEAVEPFEDWYPEDITPPAGTVYPCALKALPRDLPGIPAVDHRHINHVYSQLLQCTQARLIVYKGLSEANAQLPRLLTDYLIATDSALAKLRAEPAPSGLAEFLTDVTRAVELQQTFFRTAVPRRLRGEPMQKIHGIAEGKQASALLHSAWSRMRGRYSSWDPAVKDSIYHHLCALDLF